MDTAEHTPGNLIRRRWMDVESGVAPNLYPDPSGPQEELGGVYHGLFHQDRKGKNIEGGSIVFLKLK